MEPTHIKKGLFGVRYYYLDNVTRIRYGLSIKNLGIAYTLERKGRYFWKEVAWTYPETHRNSDMQHVIEYLQWKETDAKEMERKQTFDCYRAGTAQFDNSAPIVNPKTPEQYYNETYGK